MSQMNDDFNPIQANSSLSVSTHKALNISASSAQTAGNYDILNDLGEGTFGSVKLGKHSQKGNLVAIKILEKSRIKEQADVERVLREIQILKQI
jgi:serine/threonine protein kinase